jgi:AcrR family transcriptional regulator
MNSPKPKEARPGPGRLSAEQAAQLEDRLLDAAMRLFSRNGFSGTTMEAIAKEAGASTKTVYARYANKAEVVEALNVRLAERIAAARAAAAPRPQGMDPRDALLSIGRTQAHIYDSDEVVGLTRIAISEAHRMPSLVESFIKGFQRSVSAIGDQLAGWEGAGLLTLPGKPDVAARIFVEMVVGTPRIRAVIGRPLSPIELDEHVNTAVETFLTGCRYSAPSKSITRIQGRA